MDEGKVAPPVECPEKALPSEWADYLAVLASSDDVLEMLADIDDERSRQEVYRLLFQSLAIGYFTAFADPAFPDFVPLVNSVFNSVGTNPDFIYAYAAIDGRHAYRLSGYRGDGVFLLLDFAAGWLSVLDEPGPSLGVLDVDTLTLALDGGFAVLLSAERPAGYEGDWFALDPAATAVNVRQASYDWGRGRDARLALERLDGPASPTAPDASEIARRLQRLAAYPQRYVRFALEYCRSQRERGIANALEHDDWAGRGGLSGQHYYQGLFKLEAGTALVLETAMPEQVRYWNVQLNDPWWNTIGWLDHQGSLNGGQAVLDDDGRFRAVIAVDDPGVPNWLDPGGFEQGSIMLRWTGASSGPAPSLRLVAATEIRKFLPASTAVVTPEQRRESLRQRRRGAQLRRRW